MILNSQHEIQILSRPLRRIYPHVLSMAGLKSNLHFVEYLNLDGDTRWEDCSCWSEKRHPLSVIVLNLRKCAEINFSKDSWEFKHIFESPTHSY